MAGLLLLITITPKEHEQRIQQFNTGPPIATASDPFDFMVGAF